MVFRCRFATTLVLKLRLPLFYRRPQVIVDNTKFRDFMDDPFIFGVHPRLPTTRIWIFQETLSVPDEPPDVYLVAQDDGATLGVAVDGAEPPIPTAGCSDAVLVQFGSDSLGRFSRNLVCQDTAHHTCFVLVNRAVTPYRLAFRREFLDDVIPIGISAS